MDVRREVNAVEHTIRHRGMTGGLGDFVCVAQGQLASYRPVFDGPCEVLGEGLGQPRDSPPTSRTIFPGYPRVGAPDSTVLSTGSV